MPSPLVSEAEVTWLHFIGMLFALMALKSEKYNISSQRNVISVKPYLTYIAAFMIISKPHSCC